LAGGGGEQKKPGEGAWSASSSCSLEVKSYSILSFPLFLVLCSNILDTIVHGVIHGSTGKPLLSWSESLALLPRLFELMRR
jgi:hypothetical protein